LELAAAYYASYGATTSSDLFFDNNAARSYNLPLVGGYHVELGCSLENLRQNRRRQRGQVHHDENRGLQIRRQRLDDRRNGSNPPADVPITTMLGTFCF
jgi:hypothetical protein